ncbi:MAG: signal peptidase I [Verrucomicrobia bacterium]|nr:signal peptidase I [Verrucomicrobiota bacterium]
MTTEAAPPPPDPWLKRLVIGRNPRWTLARVFVVVVIVFVLFKFVFIPIKVVGISMEPTYVEGRIRLVNKLAYRHSEPQRGDIVAVQLKSERVVLLKRIIGLPGERVVFADRKIYVNGKELDEPYVKLPVHHSWSSNYAWLIPKNMYLVIGDNRSMAFKEHFRYLAEKDEILGRVAH